MRQGRLKDILSYIRSSILVLVISAAIEILSGSVLSDIFCTSYFPGLLVLLPPLMELRGNISSAFAAKFSTGLHLGTIKPNFRNNTKKFKSDIYSFIIILIVMPIILGIFVWIFCIIFNIPNLGLLYFIIISLLTGLIAGTIMAIISIALSILTFKYGLDPDSIVVPILGFSGDIISIITVYFVIKILEIIGLGLFI